MRNSINHPASPHGPTTRSPHIRRLKHLIATVLLALALATILAWVFAWFGQLNASSFMPAPQPGELAGWRVRIPRDWTPRTWLVRSGFGVRHDLVSECIWAGSTLGASESTAPNRTMQLVSVGWPFPALQWTAYPDAQSSRASAPGSPQAASGPLATLKRAWSSGFEISRTRVLLTGDLRRLPIRPAWAGLAANVALFSFGSHYLLDFLSRRREARRRHLGLCISCAYDLKGMARCPECGAQAPPATISP